MGTTVAIDDVMEALELATDEASSYVNKTTGQVLTVSHEHLHLAEEDAEHEGPEWEQQAVAEAKQVIDSDQWLKLPSKFDVHEWQTMDDFATSLTSEAARSELRGAIRGNGAFRNFKGAIRRLGIEKAWFAFKEGAIERLAREWLARHDFSVGEGRTAQQRS